MYCVNRRLASIGVHLYPIWDRLDVTLLAVYKNDYIDRGIDKHVHIHRRIDLRGMCMCVCVCVCVRVRACVSGYTCVLGCKCVCVFECNMSRCRFFYRFYLNPKTPPTPDSQPAELR